MADIRIAILRPLIFLILFFRISTRNKLILNENDLTEVSEFVVSKHWPKYEGINKFELGIVKLWRIENIPPKYVNKGKSYKRKPAELTSPYCLSYCHVVTSPKTLGRTINTHVEFVIKRFDGTNMEYFVMAANCGIM